LTPPSRRNLRDLDLDLEEATPPDSVKNER